MRGTRIPTAKRLINRFPPLNPADESEANADNLMFLYDNTETGDYIQDSAIIARHLDNLRCREQATPNLTVEVRPGSATFQTTFVTSAGGTSPTCPAPITNPRIDIIALRSDGVIVRAAGTEAASPVAPGIPVNSIPLCTIYNVVGQTAIHDNDTQVAGQGYILQDLRPFLGIGGGVIKSIQQGTIDLAFSAVSTQGQTVTATATITAVDPTKAHAILLGYELPTPPGGGNPNSWSAKVDLTNGTTVTAIGTATGSGAPTFTLRVGFVIVEYLL